MSDFPTYPPLDSRRSAESSSTIRLRSGGPVPETPSGWSRIRRIGANRRPLGDSAPAPGSWNTESPHSAGSAQESWW